MKVSNEVFHLHKNLACQASPFITNAVKPEWKTHKKSDFVDLSDVEISMFKPYMTFLYTSEVLRSQTWKWDWEMAAKCYQLGERLMDTSFQQAVLDKIIKQCSSGLFVEMKPPPISAVRMFYERTTVGSPVRRLMVDYTVCHLFSVVKALVC